MTTTTPVRSPALCTRSLLQVSDLSPGEFSHLLTLAGAMKSDPTGWLESHRGQTLACLFSKPSTRTRVSLEGAANRLGMLPVMLRPDELQLGRGEPLADTARVLSGYVDAVSVRTFAQADVEGLAAAGTIPVINALTDQHHPLQALADMLTIKEQFGDLRGLKLAYLGDGNNVAHSLIQAGALTGVQVAVATPVGYAPEMQIVVDAVQAAGGHSVELTNDPEHAVAGAHAIYTDVWTSMGQDDERAQRFRDFEGYRVTAQLMDLADPEAIFMHCLPAHRGEEVEAAVIDGVQSVVFTQAANRMPTAQAVIHALIDAAESA